MSFWKDKKVLVTGAHGFVGHAVVSLLRQRGVVQISVPSHTECDLAAERDVERLFKDTQYDMAIHLAGKVGGIAANKAGLGEFFYQNLMMGTLLMEYARRYGVPKVVALAAGCGYPKNLDAPFREAEFWDGLPDMNSYGYSMAKKMLVIQSWAFREQYGFNSVILIPANLYGPHDNFNLENSHVVPALLRKFVEARINKESKVVVWGSGKATREFLYVDDAARVIVDAAERIDEPGPFNLGTGVETSVKELVETIRVIVGYEGEVVWDTSRPDGQPRRYYDMCLLKQKLGYVPSTPLADGLRETIAWYEAHREQILKFERAGQRGQ